MSWRLYAVVSAGAFAATYLMSPPTPDPGQITSSPSRPSARQASDGHEIQELADQLHARLRATATYREPGRDPFRFTPRTAPSAAMRPSPEVVVAPVAVPVPARPLVTLSGIAADEVNGVMQRTAVLSAPAGVLLAREGETVAGLYRLVSISEDSVEIEVVADGSRQTLVLGR